jgi:hypothetical protein
MTKHTPGPWITSAMYGLQNEHEYLVWANDAAVCHVFQRSENADPAATQRANARLIASAPDLLAALQSMLDADDAICNNVGRGVDQAMSRIAAIDSARAAIARAQGE